MSLSSLGEILIEILSRENTLLTASIPQAKPTDSKITVAP